MKKSILIRDISLIFVLLIIIALSTGISFAEESIDIGESTIDLEANEADEEVPEEEEDPLNESIIDPEGDDSEDEGIKEEAIDDAIEEEAIDDAIEEEAIEESGIQDEIIIQDYLEKTYHSVTLATETSTALPTTGKTETNTVERIAGDNRYETSLRIADELKSELKVDRFNNVVIASGEAYPDALSGAYLANRNNAPIILTSKSNEVESIIVEYIKKNLIRNGRVFILGGVAAVPSTLEKSFPEFIVKRVAGKDRYETNLAILNEAKAATYSDDLLMCSGLNYPDALSAAATDKPILLVGKELTDTQKKYLEKTSFDYYIIGGTAAVSKSVERDVQSYGSLKRIAGGNRYETSVAVAEAFDNTSNKSGKSKEDKSGIVMASGMNFPDGLAGGPLAVKKGMPLVLADNESPATARNYAVKASLYKYVLLGGKALIDDNIAINIANQVPAGTKLTSKAGIVKLNKEYADFNPDGTISTSKWVSVGEDRYYALPSGALARNQVFQVDGAKYGAGEDGKLKKGFVVINDKEYYFLSDYRMPTEIETNYDYYYSNSPNYDSGRMGNPIETIMIHHWGEYYITFNGVVNWFSVWYSGVSAHYVVQNGIVTQMVREGDTAWHAGDFSQNTRSIGIECRPAKTAGDVNTVLELICDIWVRYGEIIPLCEHREYSSTYCPGEWDADELYILAKRKMVEMAR